MGCDVVKIALMDSITSPNLDLSVMKGIQSCAQCKNFGPAHLNALLQPITRRHPFELIVGDYLSMPPGKGGFHMIALYLDTFSQHVWAFKYKTAGTVTFCRTRYHICLHLALLCICDMRALDATAQVAMTAQYDLLFMVLVAFCLYDTRCVDK
jgi:hypothetical protein